MRHARVALIGDTCDDHTSPTATEVNVPQHTKNGTNMQLNHTPPDGPVEILIVTYRKDFPWLAYALKTIAKHSLGFAGITILVPDGDLHALMEVSNDTRARHDLNDADIKCVAKTFTEVPGRGMLHHMVMMATAERIVPQNTRYVFHMDGDCMFKEDTDVSHFFHDGKPIYLYRTWDSLTTEDPRNPGTKVISDCAQWKGPTEQQLGMPSDVYTMCRHPTIFPIDFYREYRQHIGKVHGSFEQYMLAGRNAFPQDRMDFTAMGQWAWTHMRDRFHWINCAAEPFPADRLKAYWSHGGITPEIKAEIEGFLR